VIPLAMLVYPLPLLVERYTLYVIGAVPEEQAVQVSVTLPVPAVAFGLFTVPGTVAVTIILNEQLAVLPDASVAVQVTVLVPCAKVEPLAGLQLEVTPEQLSLTVGANVTTGVLQVLVVMLAGQVIVGLVVSLTVTVNEQLLVPWPVSMALQVTDVVPLANVEPLVGVQVVVTDPPQALVPVAVHLITCEQEVDVVLVVMLPGQVMVGSGACSVTAKLQELVLPQSSVAVQVTLVLPATKPTPGTGTQTTVGTPPQLSVAVGGVYCTEPPEHTVVVPLLQTQGKVRLPQKLPKVPARAPKTQCCLKFSGVQAASLFL
jgi:hypothetical protein